jgi:hypothetical protein
VQAGGAAAAADSRPLDGTPEHNTCMNCCPSFLHAYKERAKACMRRMFSMCSARRTKSRSVHVVHDTRSRQAARGAAWRTLSSPAPVPPRPRRHHPPRHFTGVHSFFRPMSRYPKAAAPPSSLGAMDQYLPAPAITSALGGFHTFRAPLLSSISPMDPYPEGALGAMGTYPATLPGSIGSTDRYTTVAIGPMDTYPATLPGSVGSTDGYPTGAIGPMDTYQAPLRSSVSPMDPYPEGARGPMDTYPATLPGSVGSTDRYREAPAGSLGTMDTYTRGPSSRPRGDLEGPAAPPEDLSSSQTSPLSSVGTLTDIARARASWQGGRPSLAMPRPALFSPLQLPASLAAGSLAGSELADGFPDPPDPGHVVPRGVPLPVGEPSLGLCSFLRELSEESSGVFSDLWQSQLSRMPAYAAHEFSSPWEFLCGSGNGGMSSAKHVLSIIYSKSLEGDAAISARFEQCVNGAALRCRSWEVVLAVSDLSMTAMRILMDAHARAMSMHLAEPRRRLPAYTVEGEERAQLMTPYARYRTGQDDIDLQFEGDMAPGGISADGRLQAALLGELEDLLGI